MEALKITIENRKSENKHNLILQQTRTENRNRRIELCEKPNTIICTDINEKNTKWRSSKTTVQGKLIEQNL